MPKYAEIIFETGAKSVISYEDEDELKNFLTEHHRRAVQGLPGASQDQEERSDIDYSQPGNVHPDRAKQRPAERIFNVLEYGDTHPADLHPVGVDVKTVKELIEGMADEDGRIDDQQLIRALRDEVSPVYPVSQGHRESIYKADAENELDLEFLKEVE